MNTSVNSSLRRLVLMAGWLALAHGALSASEAGAVAFVAGQQTYLGQYRLSEAALSVEIDGLMYRGHYAARADDAGALPPDAASTGQWGRAFLFASSAQVLQCQLTTGFPQVSGHCQAADGRRFELKPVARP